MAYRIVQDFKRLAVQVALRFLPVADYEQAAPKPRIRSLERDDTISALDNLLFSPNGSNVSLAAGLLGGELSRVSGKMGDLRKLLADLARFEPAHTIEVNSISGQNFQWSEDVLFDADAYSVPSQPVLAVSDSAEFLFDDEVMQTPSWQELRLTESGGLQHV